MGKKEMTIRFPTLPRITVVETYHFHCNSSITHPIQLRNPANKGNKTSPIVQRKKRETPTKGKETTKEICFSNECVPLDLAQQ
jgi:hypothetical protein